jgi:restriction system protein
VTDESRYLVAVPSNQDIPSYQTLMLPVLRELERRGGSAKTQELIDAVVDSSGLPEELIERTYPNRPSKSILRDRIAWAISYCTLTGLCERPRRGLYLISQTGLEILRLDTAESERRIKELEKRVRRERRSPQDEPDDVHNLAQSDSPSESSWRDEFLNRLHQLTPRAFEEFCILLLRAYGMELQYVGGTGDEGIDALGRAPVSPVLSMRVAVQIKRYDPAGAPVPRERVALFQRDARTKGAERAVMVTLGRFSRSAREAAVQDTPTVELIDGERLAELALEQGLGIRQRPMVEKNWFTRFETG